MQVQRVEIVHVGRHIVVYRRAHDHPMGVVGQASIPRFLAMVNRDTSRLVAGA